MGSKVRFQLTPDIHIYEKQTATISTLTFSRSLTVPDMVAPAVRRASEPISVSVDDIYKIAERERLCYSARGRRNAVERAQSQTYKMEEMYRSRPHTSASGYINAYRRDIATPTKSIRSEPVPSRVSSRAAGDYDEDDIEEYPINFVNSPSVCCEIIGPQTCEECLKQHRRRLDREKSDARFPSIRISNQNITTTAMLQRYFPNLSHEEIQIKLARGEIAKPNILNRSAEKNNKDKHSSQSKKSRDSPGLTRAKQSIMQMKFKSMFFVNIQDLNSKINSGKVSRSLGFNCNPVVKKKVVSETERVFPSFVSPRKVHFIYEASGKKFHYEPPLLPKENQIDEPGFFAGSENTYKLPERLPDKIEFIEDGKTKRSISVSDVVSDITDSALDSKDADLSIQSQSDALSQTSEVEKEMDISLNEDESTGSYIKKSQSEYFDNKRLEEFMDGNQPVNTKDS